MSYARLSEAISIFGTILNLCEGMLVTRLGVPCIQSKQLNTVHVTKNRVDFKYYRCYLTK